MSMLFLMRHGQASFGQSRYDRLSPTGYQQARLVAKHLHDIGITFDAVYTGELIRQQQTYEGMAEVFRTSGAPLPTSTVATELNEYDAAGIWKAYYPTIVRENPDLELDETTLAENPKQFQKVFARIVKLWISGNDNPAGIESWPSFRSRIDTGLKNIMRHEGSGKNVMIVSSAGPIALTVQMATGMPDSQCIGISWQVMNASLTRFRYNSTQMTLAGFNDVAALEIHGDASLLTYR